MQNYIKAAVQFVYTSQDMLPQEDIIAPVQCGATGSIFHWC